MGTNTRRNDGRIGDRITFDHSEDTLRVDIRQQIPPAQMSLLSIWLVAWCALEAAVVYFWTQEPNEGNAWLGYAIYSAFWGFFAFRIGKVWLWRLRGREVLVVAAGVSIAMAFGERGLPDFCPRDLFPAAADQGKPAANLRTFESAFWSLGGETLQFSAASAR